MSRHLQHIQVERYGGLQHRAIGPFAPGLNVVYGPNEAGKSTLSSLVRGVLFGWEDAHGVRNTYRPDEGGRAGELVFSAPDGEVARLARDESGVYGDKTVVGDIDRATFDEVFAFSAEELRVMRSSSAATARLLAAASGTGTSPSTAYVEVEQRIAATTREIVELTKREEQAVEQVKRATDQVELFKQEDRELSELHASRVGALERIDVLNGELEDLIAWKSELETLDRRAEGLRDDIESLRAERREFVAGQPGASGLDERLLTLDAASERVLRDAIDEYAEQQEKASRILDAAKENSASSTAAYEALVELDEKPEKGKRTKFEMTSWARIIVAILLPFVFVGAGIPLFIHGREIESLSITTLALALILLAVVLAVTAFVAVFRTSRDESSIDERLKDAQWVMLQDRKKLDACVAEKEQLSEEIERFLDSSGLAAAEGSLRQARSLLDAARDQRSANASADQRLSALDLRIRVAREQLSDIMAARRRIEEAVATHLYPAGEAAVTPGAGVLGAKGADLPSGSLADAGAASANATVNASAGSAPLSAREMEGLIRKCTSERDALVESAESMSQRIGELTNALEQAKRDNTFPLLKFRRHELRALLEDRKQELIELLLAKRMLERSIAAWENQSQPEVYERASSLLADITDGRWVRVSTSATGSVVAIDGHGVERDPRHLSLGTCQQLYLALRVSLLLTASDVGREVPVLADDVLVNFDASRRAGAARVLAELAKERQVIVFTCHEETVAALPGAKRIDL